MCPYSLQQRVAWNLKGISKKENASAKTVYGVVEL